MTIGVLVGMLVEGMGKKEKRMKKRSHIQKLMESTKPSGGSLNRLADDLRRRIKEAAYELYERHGREDGRDVEDWLQAEAIVIDQYPKHLEKT